MSAMKRRVALAMSGGVDSAVSALLLKSKGYLVEGVHMSNWDEVDEHGSNSRCPSERDYSDVTDVCSKIGIKCKRVEFVKDYWNDVFSNFLQDINKGLTPNPDVLCNQKIKFGVFQKHVFHQMNDSLMATGHYARINHLNNGAVQLLKAIDSFKDQTYFLSTVSQESLKKVMFPIGHLTKAQVRQIALEAGLFKTVERKESMGLCFIGKRKFPTFLKEYIEDRPGLFLSHDGHVMGEHKGHHHFTIGQRARIGGMKKPWFVSSKDHHNNTVYIVEGEDHPLLFCKVFRTGPAHWIREGMRDGEERTVEARYRHQQDLFTCSVKADGINLVVKANHPLKAVTPGQYVVFYNQDECLGGACIVNTFLNKKI